MSCGLGENFNPEVAAARIRKGLDVIGSEPGSILYRGDDYWKALPPGSEGQVLGVSVDGLPEWQAASGGGFNSWSDDFETADPLGKHYFGVGVNSTKASILGGLLRITGGGGSQVYAALVPKLVVGLDGQSQFVRAVLASDNGATSNVTRPFLTSLAMGYWDVSTLLTQLNAYIWIMVKEGGSSVLQKQTAGNVAINLATGLPYPSAGQTLELQTVVNGTSSVDLVAKIDGSTVGSATDSSSPYLVGLPGLGSRTNGNSTRFSEFDDLVVGAL